MAHNHHHDHDHAEHHSHHESRLRLLIALLITSGFVVFEILAGIQSNSLALLSDALHNLTDALALGIAWFAIRITERAPHAGKTFGYHRAGILAALFNASTLIGIAGIIAFEAFNRIQAPEVVDWETLLGVGALALLVNATTAWLVGHGAKDDLNLHSAFLHLLGDVLSNLGAMAAGLGIYLTGLSWMDPLASVMIAFLILWNAWLIIRETLDILMESVPRDVPMTQVVARLLENEGVLGIHDLHIWSLTRSLRFISAHIEVSDRPVSQTEALKRALCECLESEFRISHATFQFESTPSCSSRLYCELGPRGSRQTVKEHSPRPEQGQEP